MESTDFMQSEYTGTLYVPVGPQKTCAPIRVRILLRTTGPAEFIGIRMGLR